MLAGSACTQRQLLHGRRCTFCSWKGALPCCCASTWQLSRSVARGLPCPMHSHDLLIVQGPEPSRWLSTPTWQLELAPFFGFSRMPSCVAVSHPLGQTCHSVLLNMHRGGQLGQLNGPAWFELLAHVAADQEREEHCAGGTGGQTVRSRAGFGAAGSGVRLSRRSPSKLQVCARDGTR